MTLIVSGSLATKHTSAGQVLTEGNLGFPTLDHLSKFIGLWGGFEISGSVNVFFVCGTVSVKGLGFPCFWALWSGPLGSFLPFTKTLPALLFDRFCYIFVLSSFGSLKQNRQLNRFLIYKSKSQSLSIPIKISTFGVDSLTSLSDSFSFTLMVRLVSKGALHVDLLLINSIHSLAMPCSVSVHMILGAEQRLFSQHRALIKWINDTLLVFSFNIVLGCKRKNALFGNLINLYINILNIWILKWKFKLIMTQITYFSFIYV